MKLSFSVIALALGLTTAASAATFGPLVEPEELSASINTAEPILLDIRGQAYHENHIDGAISAPYSIFRGPKENPGQLVDVETLETKFEELGLEQDVPIVVISDGKTSTDFGAAARVYWTLKSTGFTDLSILNGGHAAWAKAGLDVSSTPSNLIPSELELTFSDQWLANTGDISSVVDGKSSAILVDSRFEDFYVGDKAHGAAKKPGTIPGAINHSFANFFEKDTPAISKVSDPDALKVALGIKEKEEVISFCNTGHWAASHWFAVSELAGVENAKLYAGSMVEYSNADLPMENTPGFLSNIIRQIKN